MLEDPHFRPRDHAERWRRLAAHLRRHPEDFSIAVETLDRWEAWGRTHPGPIREWRARIAAAQRGSAAMADLLAWMAEDNHDTEPLKSCSPFAGIALDKIAPSA